MSSQNVNRPYGRVFGKVVLTALFTAVELWSVVVLLTQLHVGGVVAVALAAVMSGAVLAAVYGWQEVRAQSGRSTGGDEFSERPRWTRETSTLIDDVYPIRGSGPRRDQIAV
jgi:hypothetical protein